MVYLSPNSSTSNGYSQKLKPSDFPIFRTATVVDASSNYYGKSGKIVANNYDVSIEIKGAKTPRGKQRSIGFKPEQLKLNPEPQEWKPPAMPWSENATESPGHPISFGKTLEQLWSGQKTVTRREWTSSYANYFIQRFEKGLPVQAIDKDRRYGGKVIGSLKLTQRPYPEQLRDMPESDVAAEGFPEMSKQEFIDRFFEGDEGKVPWVVRFEFTPNDETPAPNAQPSEPTFREKFRTECVEGSGIDPDLYDAAIQFVLDVEPMDGGEVKLAIHELLGWSQDKFVRFGHQVKPTLEAAAFFNEDGTLWQCKLSEPLLDKDGKIRKYEAPTAGGDRIYLPPVPPSIRQKIAHRWGVAVPMEGSFWKWVFGSKLVPVMPTEGGKKTLSALSQGVPAIGFYGCWGGVNSKDISGRSTVPELHPDLKPFAVPGRTFYLAMDKDSKPSTVKDVTAATNRLGACLEKAGCCVRVCQWEPKQGKGIDDFLVKGGDIDALLTNAPVVSFQGKEWKSKNKRLLKFFEDEFGDRLRLNEMTLKLEIDGQPVDLDTLFLTIADLYDIDISESLSIRLAAHIARRNAYSPVRDYLDSLAPGDPAILDSLAEKYLGNTDPMASRLLRRTLIAAVARAYEPGCQHDAITIFQSQAQGMFKSTFWQVLAGEDFFTDAINSQQGKDETLVMRGSWIIEYSEFESAYRKKEIEEIKGFITRRVDPIRVPYDREVTKFPRTCILVGTTNQSEFLRDPTGDERRFWVIPIRRQIPLSEVRAMRDLIWAAARTAYLSGERWHMTAEENQELYAYTSQFKETDPWQEEISEFLEHRTVVRLREVLDALGIQTHTRDKKVTGRITSILRALGWVSGCYDESGKNRAWRKKQQEKNAIFNVGNVGKASEPLLGEGSFTDIDTDIDTDITDITDIDTDIDTDITDITDIDRHCPETQCRDSEPLQDGASTLPTLKIAKKTTFLEKTEKQFLPIGTWVCRYGREYFQVAVHYPQWEGFAKPDGTIIGALDPKDYEVVEEPPAWKQKGFEVGMRVKYSEAAIQREIQSRENYKRRTGRENDIPWSPDWEYRIEAIDPDDTCHLKRLGGGKGKRTKELKATWLEVVK